MNVRSRFATTDCVEPPAVVAGGPKRTLVGDNWAKIIQGAWDKGQL
jgi:hypothetical protein